MLHGVGDVDSVPVDASFLEATVEQESSGTDERPAFNVFAVPGLFADEDEPRARFPFAEDGLRSVFIQRASLTMAGRSAEALEIAMRGEEIRRRASWVRSHSFWDAGRCLWETSTETRKSVAPSMLG
jgi:hypothetical protein